jgi:malonyl-CoA decarboxylase
MFARIPALERAVLALRHVPVGDPAAREHAITLRTAIRDALHAGDEGVLRVLRLLDGLDVDAAQLDDALTRMRSASDGAGRRRAAVRLRAVLEPSRDRVLSHVAVDPEGLRSLIDLRAALLGLLERRRDLAELSALDDELRAFLAARFDLGVLELRRLTWHDSAALLERLARAEAVHAVRGWFDLKDRLDDDRRVYALFHPALPDVPLVFTEVALTDEFPASIRAILNLEAPRTDPHTARYATFYSISNCEPGLGGIPFGDALLKRAVDRLRRELPRLRTFATLSPIPGFGAWFAELGEAVPREVREVLATPGWHRDEALVARVREPLSRIAARYLLAAKRESADPRDPVERFHIRNGATADRICFLADPSDRGLRQSFGVMVSYRYVLDRIADNQVAYALDGQVDASNAVSALSEEAPFTGIPERTRPQRLRAALARLGARLRPRRTARATTVSP